MSLQIVQIVDRGQPNRERLHLRVMADTNLQYFLVLSTSYLTPAAISNIPRHTYWFAPKLVRAGDEVVLITGHGTPIEAPNPSGSTIHYFYWGLPQTVWNTTGECAVVLEVTTWETTRYE